MSEFYLWAVTLFAVGMLIWDTIEVGRNDAANIVNAVFGARILSVQAAVRLAGVGVVFGAYFSSGVIETARKGIFDPAVFDVERALSIYISVYIVDTILLYTYSAFGMPVSTTMTLVFELFGAGLFMGLFGMDHPVNAVKWNSAARVIAGIVCSILLSGVMGFFLQRIARGAIRDKWSSLPALLLHGGTIGGGLMAGLSYFMLIKGMKDLAIIQRLNQEVLSHAYGPILTLILLWVAFAVLIHLSLVFFRQKAARYLFPVLTVLGMIALAFAFGQNDLANCAAPGLAALSLISGHRDGKSVADISAVAIGGWKLLACGLLLMGGMMTKNAIRVTLASVRAGSAGDHVELYAPRWSIRLAHLLLRFRRKAPSLAPAFTKTAAGRTMHYDPLRACVIVSVSASVIAAASALGLPVSTTYVAFAAVIATGMADRIFVRGDAALKLGRSIWTVFSWFAAAVVSTLATGIICLLVYHLGIPGMVFCVAVNVLIRGFVKRHADAQELRVQREAEERAHPEQFALEDESAG